MYCLPNHAEHTSRSKLICLCWLIVHFLGSWLGKKWWLPNFFQIHFYIILADLAFFILLPFPSQYSFYLLLLLLLLLLFLKKTQYQNVENNSYFDWIAHLFRCAMSYQALPRFDGLTADWSGRTLHWGRSRHTAQLARMPTLALLATHGLPQCGTLRKCVPGFTPKIKILTFL